MGTRSARAWGLAVATLWLCGLLAGNTARAAGSAGAVQFSAVSYVVYPDDGLLFVTIDRVGGASGPVVVTYSTFDSTALAGIDYVPTSGSLAWADGDAAPQTFSVPISSGSVGGGSFSLALMSASGAQFGDIIAANAYILPPTPPVTSWPGAVELSQSLYTLSPTASGILISIDRVQGAGGPVIASYVATGAGASTVSGSVSWGDGDGTPKSFYVPVVGSSPGTSFAVALTSAQGASFGSPIDATVEVRATVPTSVNLTWTPPSYNTDGTPLTDLAGYYLYFGTPGVATERIQISDPVATALTVGGLVPGTWYFTLMAYNSEGAESELTEPVSAIIQ